MNLQTEKRIGRPGGKIEESWAFACPYPPREIGAYSRLVVWKKRGKRTVIWEVLKIVELVRTQNLADRVNVYQLAKPLFANWALGDSKEQATNLSFTVRRHYGSVWVFNEQTAFSEIIKRNYNLPAISTANLFVMEPGDLSKLAERAMKKLSAHFLTMREAYAAADPSELTTEQRATQAWYATAVDSVKQYY